MHARLTTLLLETFSESLIFPNAMEIIDDQNHCPGTSLPKCVLATPTKKRSTLGEKQSSSNTPTAVETFVKTPSSKFLSQSQHQTSSSSLLSVMSTQSQPTLQQENDKLKSDCARLVQALVEAQRLLEHGIEHAAKTPLKTNLKNQEYLSAKLSVARPTPLKAKSVQLEVQIVSHVVLDDRAEYRIEVRFGAKEKNIGHTITRRYFEFREFRQDLLHVATLSLKSQHSREECLKRIRAALFPNTTWFRSLDESFLKERSEVLNQFLNQVVIAARRDGRGSALRNIVSSWLGLDQYHGGDLDGIWCDDRFTPLKHFEERTTSARISDAFTLALKEDLQDCEE